MTWRIAYRIWLARMQVKGKSRPNVAFRESSGGGGPVVPHLGMKRRGLTMTFSAFPRRFWSLMLARTQRHRVNSTF